MVREHVIGRGIEDARVVAAMRKIPRHLFVDAALADRAYDDRSLPIGREQTISQPFMAAFMTAALRLAPEQKVLEVGTGSGYQTALLAEMLVNVFSVESIPFLAARARRLLDRLGYFNAAIRVGDGTLGWPEHAPYDAIVVTAAGPAPPRPLLEQLAVGGRMVIPLGDRDSQELKLIVRTRLGFRQESLGECRFVTLQGKFGWRG